MQHTLNWRGMLLHSILKSRGQIVQDWQLSRVSRHFWSKFYQFYPDYQGWGVLCMVCNVFTKLRVTRVTRGLFRPGINPDPPVLLKPKHPGKRWLMHVTVDKVPQLLADRLEALAGLAGSREAIGKGSACGLVFDAFEVLIYVGGEGLVACGDFCFSWSGHWVGPLLVGLFP